MNFHTHTRAYHPRLRGVHAILRVLSQTRPKKTECEHKTGVLQKAIQKTTDKQTSAGENSTENTLRSVFVSSRKSTFCTIKYGYAEKSST